MKKTIALLLSAVFLFSSCKTTFYANNQRLLRNKYVNTPFENVLNDLGKPDEVEERTFGKSYVYYYMGRQNGVHEEVEQYTRFNVDRDGFVTDVKSTATVKTKRVSVGRTVGVSLLGIVVLAFLAALSSNSSE